MILIKRKKTSDHDFGGFHCDCCGMCCKFKNIIPEGLGDDELSDEAKFINEELDRGDGVCKFLDEETNLCKIYDHRPDICNVKTLYCKYFKDRMTPEEYVRRTNETCKLFKEVMK